MARRPPRGHVEGGADSSVRERASPPEAAAADRAGPVVEARRSRSGRRAVGRHRRVSLRAECQDVIFVYSSFWIAIRVARDELLEFALELLLDHIYVPL